MTPLLQEWKDAPPPEVWAGQLAGEPGTMLVSSGLQGREKGRYSFLVARPFLSFRSAWNRCDITAAGRTERRVGNPWKILGRLLEPYQVADGPEWPVPLGGCFGFWGYDLRHFVDRRMSRWAVRDLPLPDCQVGFYGSLLAFDHQDHRTWVVATGLGPEGRPCPERARRQLGFWEEQREALARQTAMANSGSSRTPGLGMPGMAPPSSLSRQEFMDRVKRALRHITAGDIYQVNLAHRIEVPLTMRAWDLFLELSRHSPAPYAAYLNAGDFQMASSSPEQFIRMEDDSIQTRPIKGTRPRSEDPGRDEALARELSDSPKEQAELLMITDLLRNDLGQVCAYGSVMVPDMMRLERFAQVQHLVSTVTGRLRPELTHLQALEACFPGGSVTGAPKIQAMKIIDELEPVARGPYTGALGYLGFNRRSQLNIIIRTAVVRNERVYFHAGAGIVADSDPEMEYEETLAKAGGFLRALSLEPGVLASA